MYIVQAVASWVAVMLKWLQQQQWRNNDCAKVRSYIVLSSNFVLYFYAELNLPFIFLLSSNFIFIFMLSSNFILYLYAEPKLPFYIFMLSSEYMLYFYAIAPPSFYISMLSSNFILFLYAIATHSFYIFLCLAQPSFYISILHFIHCAKLNLHFIFDSFMRQSESIHCIQLRILAAYWSRFYIKSLEMLAHLKIETCLFVSWSLKRTVS